MKMKNHDVQEGEPEDEKLSLTTNNNLATTVNVKKTRKNMFKLSRSFYGLALSFLTAFLGSVTITLVKKAHLLNSSDQNFIRYTTQFIITSIVIAYNKIDLSEHKNQRGVFIWRALVGVIGMMSSYTAVTLIHPSDSSAISNSNIIMTAVVSRIVFKEKLSPIHLVSVVMACAGVILVSQPSFIFNKKINSPVSFNQNNETFSLSNKSASVTHESGAIPDLTKAIGFSCASIHAIALTLIAILVKQLSTKNVHYCLNVFYTSILGAPLALVISTVLVLTNNSQLIHNLLHNFDEFKYSLMYSVLSSVVGTAYQTMFSLALQYEDPSKVSIIKTCDLFFIFILQYMLLGIKSNWFKVLGAVLIFTSGAAILMFKICDERRKKKKATESTRKDGAFSRIFFFKF
jgi:drug/metabolite transporter (DMT)-like permease